MEFDPTTITSFESAPISAICKDVIQILAREPKLIRIHDSKEVVVVGDLHGDYDTLLQIFQRYGDPLKTAYLFLGDYVGRGKHQLQTVLTLFQYKINFPNNIYLLRGNHEQRMMVDCM